MKVSYSRRAFLCLASLTGLCLWLTTISRWDYKIIDFKLNPLNLFTRGREEPINQIERLTYLSLSQFFNVATSVSRSVTGSIYQPMEGYRSPCWMEELPANYRLNNASRLQRAMRDIRLFMQPKLSETDAHYEGMRSRGIKVRMRCMPALYLGGIYKGGTADMYASLTSHHMIVEPVTKEPLWYLWGTGKMSPLHFEDYLDLMAVSAERIWAKLNGSTPNPYMTLDATSPLMHMYSRWKGLPWNRGSKEPVLTIANHLRLINPKSKVIFLLREPSAWVTSCYNYFSHLYHPPSDDDLHRRVQGDIDAFQTCAAAGGSTRECVYAGNADRCSLLNSMYVIYVGDWIQVFGQDCVLPVKSEDYYANRTAVLDKITTFLQLPPFTKADTENIARREVINKTNRKVAMLERTQKMVKGFMKKWNSELSVLLKQSGIPWSSWDK